VTPNPKTGEPEENRMLSDFYLVRDFTDGELRLLIDSLLFSKHVPYAQCRALVGKLEGLSSKYFQSRIGHIRTMADNAPQNKQLFLNIETIDEAITNGKQIAFHYNSFGTDKKMHPRKSADGSVREYVINPYQIAAANGRYYLICNYDKYDNVSNYRLDRITEIRLLDTPVKPMRQVMGLEHGLDLPKHMAEHIYMFGGESAPVTFTVKKNLLNDVMDWFGSEITFLEETDDAVTAKVTVNLAAMRLWALQYALYVRILSPQSLADNVRNDLQKAIENYDQP
jgi:predicted DNA-binding transcriptional regulator YafY